MHWYRYLPVVQWPTNARHQRLVGAGIALGLVALGFLLSHHTPGESRWLPPCLFHSITGLFCPGCGITRALHALVHGDLGRAWSMNFMAVIGLGAILVELLDRALLQPAWWSKPRSFLHDARPWAIALIIFVVGRNLPWEPFAAWAPIG